MRAGDRRGLGESDKTGENESAEVYTEVLDDGEKKHEKEEGKNQPRYHCDWLGAGIHLFLLSDRQMFRMGRFKSRPSAMNTC